MRIVFMGNPEFSLSTLESIIKSNFDLVAVVSNPPKPMGRGKKIMSTAVGEYAKKSKLRLIQPDSLRSKSFHKDLEDLNPDLLVVVAYKILPDSIIKIPKYGAINLHASLLPKYRGAGPIQWALMNGETVTGVTIFKITTTVDTGDILLQKEYLIDDDDDMLSLGMRLCRGGANLIIKAIASIKDGDSKGKRQNKSLVTSAPKITKEMTLIDWAWPAKKIHNWVRGLTPYPGMITILNNRKIRIFKTTLIPGETRSVGEIIKADQNQLIISTGDGLLSLLEIQLEGKKKMFIKDFLNGVTITIGSKLG